MELAERSSFCREYPDKPVSVLDGTKSDMGGVRKPVTALDGTKSDMGGVWKPVTALDGTKSDMGGVWKPVTTLDGTKSDMGGVWKPVTALDATKSDMGGVRKPVTALDGTKSDMGGVWKPEIIPAGTDRTAFLLPGLRPRMERAEIPRATRITRIPNRAYFFNMILSFYPVLVGGCLNGFAANPANTYLEY
jgi:hypothetical protein